MFFVFVSTRPEKKGTSCFRPVTSSLSSVNIGMGVNQDACRFKNIAHVFHVKASIED